MMIIETFITSSNFYLDMHSRTACLPIQTRHKRRQHQPQVLTHLQTEMALHLLKSLPLYQSRAPLYTIINIPLQLPICHPQLRRTRRKQNLLSPSLSFRSATVSPVGPRQAIVSGLCSLSKMRFSSCPPGCHQNTTSSISSHSHSWSRCSPTGAKSSRARRPRS